MISGAGFARRMAVKVALALVGAGAALCAGQGALAQAPAVATTGHGAADYAVLPFISEPELSPGGAFLAGLIGLGGQRRICITSLFDQAIKPVCLGVPDMMEAYGLEWAGEDHVLVHVTKQQFVEGDRWYVSRLIGVNRKTGKANLLLQDKNGQSSDRVLWVARDGSPTALVAAQSTIYTNFDGFWPAVYRVNVENGSATQILGGVEDVMHWVADGTGAVRLGYGYQDSPQKARVIYRSGGNGPFRTIDRADVGKREETISPEGFIAGSDHGILIHLDEAKRSALFEVDLPTQKDVRKIWAAPEGSWIASTITDVDRQTVLGVWLAGAKRERVWLDPELAELQAAFDKAVPGRRVHIVSFSADKQKMLVQIERADSPGAIYFYSHAEGKLHLIAYVNDKLKGEAQNPVSMIRYKARDGLEIEGVLTLPKGREAKGLPVVVMPHGGPWAHDTDDFDYWAQFVASLGYAVLQPNFRGSTGYGEDFERKGEGQLGFAMQDDLNDGLKWLVDQGIGDGKRACLVGASYGGYATMWGLARDADLWRCGISIAGVSLLRREVNDMGYNALNENSNRSAWQRMTPDFAAVSPANAVARIKAPLLLVHGKMDATVPYDQSQAMASRMKAAGKPVDFVTMPKADHNFTREEDRLALLKAMEAFLKAHNPAD